MIGSENISSNMPRLIAIGNMLLRNVNMESTVQKTTHKLIKYEWDEKAKSEFLDIININEYCMHGIKFVFLKARLLKL
jgi:hypothetical protein